ncbi:NADH dehydrogenase subunit 7 [Nostoc commune NIES-4072]|uniref:NADH dehydrogenase subunit 7 n=1 Tax=Nostoc commune NIES-4072 TaxID=2005467 RepID=A0A2R5FH95_NOSCO|nr:NADH dehydrogenase subunit 7 [Nostoc commune HK-02]GBG17990.1 NADH dehydrogenase subunit 7 [Nostoc commune NIES-4072]
MFESYSPSLAGKCEDFCNYFFPKVDEYELLITNNPIFRRRVQGIGAIAKIANAIALCQLRKS